MAALVPVASLALGCAQDLPGTVPPETQLHFPVGLLKVSSGDTDFLLVGSSNFDQRFNSGRLFLFSVDALLALVPSDETSVVFRNDFGDAISDSVRVDSLSGELAVVELDPDGDGQTAPYVLSPSRGRNELAIVRVDAAEGRLSCSAESPDASDAARARQVGFDCTNSHRVRLQARDPFPVSVTQFGERKLITIGSLGAETPFAGSVFTRATFMSDDYIAGRVSGLLGPFEPEEDCNVNEFSLNTVRGISGLIPLPNAGDDIARVLALSFQQSPQLSVIRHEVSQLESANDCANFDPATEENGGEGLLVAPSLDLRLDTVLSVLETRGAAVTADGRRAFLSTRFIDSADTTNAAIVVLDLTVEPARIISVLEVGEELARPNLDEGRADGAKLLYVGDQRFDLVYVIDVTTDLPRIAARIESRGIRELNGRQQQVRLLDQPSQMAFVQDGDRRVAFVSNFSNSTLGIIDVTDADPRRHRVIARLGRDLDPQGDSEGQ